MKGTNCTPEACREQEMHSVSAPWKGARMQVMPSTHVSLYYHILARIRGAIPGHNRFSGGCARYARLTPGYSSRTPPACVSCREDSQGLSEHRERNPWKTVMPGNRTPEACRDCSQGLSEHSERTTPGKRLCPGTARRRRARSSGSPQILLVKLHSAQSQTTLLLQGCGNTVCIDFSQASVIRVIRS